MKRPDSLRRHALAAIAVAALALAGCNRSAPEPKSPSADSSTRNDTTATASNSSGGRTTGNGSGSSATGSPGMSGSPGSGGRDAVAGGNLSALPPTAAGTAAAASAAAGATAQALDAGDRKFVSEAAAGGMFEVEVSRLAADKATDPALKTFASMLVTDHSNANDQLKALAATHDVSLPTSLPKALQAQIDKLQKASGQEFDKQYARTVGIKDHRQDIARFEKASREAKNPELKAWIDKTLPTLKEHLAAAQKLSQNGARTASTR